MKTIARLTVSTVLGVLAMGLLVFGPAGTVHYWQGWTFLVVFTLSTLAPTGYLAVRYPDALRRRMAVGPGAEARTVQKVVIVVAFVTLTASIAVSALDFRFGWSSVPAVVSVLGDALVAAGLLIAMAVTVQNGYAAANVTVEAGQRLASTGWYHYVRHPMYSGNVVLMIGMPLALGSYWGLVFVLPGLAVLAVRIVDEEKLLTQQLAGYREYAERVRYRLVPFVW
jgi:protein-S-isoprenylcysteine O-methyltransferase Ste14